MAYGDLAITLAAAIVRHFAFVELLIVATRRSRWVADSCTLEIDAKLALTTKLI
jgi:hypothetical protein